MATYNEGYYEQSTVTEEDALGTLNYIGIPLEDSKPIVTIGLTEDVVEREIYGSYASSLEAGNQLADQVSISFVPTNARFLWWMLGKRNLTTGNRTITHMDGTARKPRLSLWKQTNNAKRHVYGWSAESMNLTWNRNRLKCTMMGKGLKHAADSLSPTITWPISTTQVRDEAWNYISAMSWGGGALGPYALSLQMRQPAVGFVGYDGFYQDISEFTTIKGAYNLIVSATNGETLLADFNSSTPKTFVWTIYKADGTSSKFMTFTSTCRIAQINVTESMGKEPIYNILLLTEAISVNTTDGL